MNEVTTSERAAALGISIRPYEPSDEAFVKDSWLRSYNPTPAATGVEAARYYRDQRALASRLIAAGSVAVATHNFGPKPELAGWVCWAHQGADGGPVIHFVYVKNILRSHGLATALIAHAMGEARQAKFSHDTPAWRGLTRFLARAGLEFSPCGT